MLWNKIKRTTTKRIKIIAKCRVLWDRWINSICYINTYKYKNDDGLYNIIQFKTLFRSKCNIIYIKTVEKLLKIETKKKWVCY